MTKHWALQDAKAKFSEFLRAADNEPQVITYRGKPKYEVRLLTPGKIAKGVKPMTLLEALQRCPKIPGGLKIPKRGWEPARKIFED